MSRTMASQPAEAIQALVPRGTGHQFLLYSDSCSGISGAAHERNFGAVNRVARRLQPPPQFVVFPGDEIAGLTPVQDELREQWRHWLDQETGWLDRRTIPMWHATGNHTAYDEMSEGVFRDMLGMPSNGPAGQEGLSYWVRRGDLLLVFVHTLWTRFGGEGYADVEWVGKVLREHGDAAHKIVVGHHPVFPVNGFSGDCQRELERDCGRRLWTLLVEAGALAYLCSHILAFDVQVHRGVLQVCSAGAGTAHRMPEDIEYLHCVQVSLDGLGLRYQVLDVEGGVRERLSWPLRPDATVQWRRVPRGEGAAPVQASRESNRLQRFRFEITAGSSSNGKAQTLLCTFSPGSMPALWIGLRGAEQRLAVILAPEPGRSPHYWFGPCIPAGDRVLQFAVHPGMGPGGILFRSADKDPWSSLAAASPWGSERLPWPGRWAVGHRQGGIHDQPFQGELHSAWTAGEDLVA